MTDSLVTLFIPQANETLNSHNSTVISSPLIAYLHTAEVTAGYKTIVNHLFTLRMA